MAHELAWVANQSSPSRKEIWHSNNQARTGHQYGTTSLIDNASAHFGDVNVFYPPGPAVQGRTPRLLFLKRTTKACYLCLNLIFLCNPYRA